jgi:hypothetical protein
MVTPPRSSKHPGCSSGQYNSDEIFSFPTQSPRSIPTQSPKIISTSAHSFNDIYSSITAVSPALRGTVASPAPSLSIIPPVPSCKSPRSAVKSLFTTPVKQTAEEEAAGDSDDLFGDDEELENLDFDEIERSMTQKPKTSSDPIDKPNLSDSILGPDIDFSPGSSKVKPSSHILGAVLGVEEDARLEEEVSRLYQVQDENSLNSLNTSRISKLDR